MYGRYKLWIVNIFSVFCEASTTSLSQGEVANPTFNPVPFTYELWTDIRGIQESNLSANSFRQRIVIILLSAQWHFFKYTKTHAFTHVHVFAYIQDGRTYRNMHLHTHCYIQTYTYTHKHIYTHIGYICIYR